jgi:hypothetical protein
MDGAGADGNATPRFAAYGATKRSLAQFTKSLQAELKMQGIKKVVVHNLSPGMVTTDLLMTGGDTRVAKFFINALAEPADKVAQYLVPRIRLIANDRKSNSTYTRFLTGFKAYTKILAVINTSILNLSLLMFALSFICHVITFVLSFVRMLLTAHLTPFRSHSRSFFVCATTAF